MNNKREKEIYKVTLAGSLINLILVILKFIAGVVGSSAAMIADAVHSLSDLLTDFIVLFFVHFSAKPQDKDHDYGHGKYETMATSIIGIALLFVGIMILVNGVKSIYEAIVFHHATSPDYIAFIAALVSIAMKEWTFKFTFHAGKELNSQALIANAWHHRSDALSSIGTAIGIGGATLLGHQWAILDSVAAVVVSYFIMHTAYGLVKNSSNELLEKSLSDEIENEIKKIAEGEPFVSRVHNLCTRRIGNIIAIEMHLRMPGNMSLYEAHQHATNIEQKLRIQFGQATHINIHVEPLENH